MNKKLLATVLASTMLLGSMSVYGAVTVPETIGSSAYENASDIAGIEIPGTSKIEPVKINVILPTGLPVLLNPYGIDVPGQVLCPEVSILNKGNTAVKAILSKWKVEIENTDVATKPVLVAAKPLATSTKKEAFIYLQSNDGAGGTLPTEYTAATDKLKVVPAKVGDTVATVNYGTLAKDNGELKLQFQGNLSTNVAWTSADTIKISPTFKFEPTVVTP